MHCKYTLNIKLITHQQSCKTGVNNSNIMKTTFWILFALFMIIYSAEPNIKFKPFSISFESPYIPFALFFLVLSISFFGIHYQKKGEKQGRIEGLEEYYPKGFKEGSDFIIEEINKKIKEQGKDCTISVKRNDE